MLQFIQRLQKDLLSCYLDETPWPVGHLRLAHLDIEILSHGIIALRPRIEATSVFGMPSSRQPQYLTEQQKVDELAFKALEHWEYKPSMVVSAGVHGDETAPIECLASIVQDVLNGHIQLTFPCLFIFAHPKATQAHVRFFDQNLNRLFASLSLSGDPTLSDEMSLQKTISQEAKIADRIKIALADFYATTDPKNRWHFDLHCSIRPSLYPHFAISPMPIDPNRTQRLHQELPKLGLGAVVISNQPSSTLSWFSHAFYCAHAATLELGQLKPLGENDPQELAQFDSQMRAWLKGEEPLTALSTEDDVKGTGTNFYEVTKVLENKNEIRFISQDLLTNFNILDTQAPFAIDGSIEYVANQGEVILFANDNVSVGQRAGLIAKPLIE